MGVLLFNLFLFSVSRRRERVFAKDTVVLGISGHRRPNPRLFPDNDYSRPFWAET